MKNVIRTTCLILVLGPFALSAGESEKDVYEIKGRRTRKYVLALDEVMESGAVGRRVKRIAATKSRSDLKNYVKARRKAGVRHVNMVMYEAGRPRTKYTRRILTGKLCLKVEEGADLKALAESAGMKLKRALKSAPGYYIFEVDEPGAELEAYQLLTREKSVKEAVPLLGRLRAKKLVPNDPLFSDQWHLLNTGQGGGVVGNDVNVTNVWETYRGNGVRVAVVDDGVDLVHPDLSGNMNTSIDYNWNTASGPANDPSPHLGTDTHGTQVAGLIGAVGNNSLGGSGVAPEAEMVAMRLISGITTDLDEAQAFSHSNDLISVYNNSWGVPDGNGTVEGPDTLAVQAIENGVQNGRNGRGSIYVFSGGNGLQDLDDANADGYANSPYTISVTAATKEGAQPWYSEPGACHVIAGPGGESDVLTTDRVGDGGDNTSSVTNDLTDRNYTERFSGTSAAAPIVSGGIALMLEANPLLGWRDVQEILIATARKNDPDDIDWVYNSAGYHFNHKYGPGLLDVESAVGAALTWSNLGPRVSSGSITNLNLVIPDNDVNGVECSFVITNIIRVEHAVLSVDITHPYRGDLQAILTSPVGTESVLMNVRADNNANLYGWSFTSVRHWGENSAGTWRLRVVDRASGDTGSVDLASLQVFGSEAGVGQKPVFKYVENVSIAAGRTGSVVIAASDYVDCDDVTISASGLPYWADFSETTGTKVVTGVLDYVPASTGTFDVVFTAGDNDGVTTQIITLAVSEFPSTEVWEDFSLSSIPAGWTVRTNGDASAYWRFDNPEPRSVYTGGDAGMAIADSDNAGSVAMDSELITPVMDLSDYLSVFVSFKSDYRYSGSEMADVDVSVNGLSGPWTNVWTEDGWYRGPITRNVDVTSLAAGQSNVAVRFHYYDANFDWWWQIDDVEVYGYKPSDSDGDSIPGWWEKMFYGSETGAVAGADHDLDGMDDRDEYLAGTVPTNASSLFEVVAVSNQLAGGVVVQWSSVYGREYVVSRSTNLLEGFVGVQSNIVATPPVNTFVDGGVTNPPVLFYRISVE